MENILTSISIPRDMDSKIKHLAKSAGRTKNSVIQDALNLYLQKQDLREIERELQAKARALGIESDEDVVGMIHQHRKSQNK